MYVIFINSYLSANEECFKVDKIFSNSPEICLSFSCDDGKEMLEIYTQSHCYLAYIVSLVRVIECDDERSQIVSSASSSA